MKKHTNMPPKQTNKQTKALDKIPQRIITHNGQTLETTEKHMASDWPSCLSLYIAMSCWPPLSAPVDTSEGSHEPPSARFPDVSKPFTTNSTPPTVEESVSWPFSPAAGWSVRRRTAEVMSSRVYLISKKTFGRSPSSPEAPIPSSEPGIIWRH